MKNSDKTFRVSSNKRNAAIWVFLGIFMVAMFIQYGVVDDINESIGLCAIIALSAGLIAALLCIIFIKEYYMHVLEDGFELVKGKKVTKYDFSAFAGSHVTRHYMNGIYYGTSREINIKDVSGKTLKINANNLSKGRFAELVTYLGQARFTNTHDIEATAEYFKNGIEFRIPNAEMIKANRNKFIIRTIIMIALFVAFIVMLIMSLVSGMDSAGFFTAMILAGICGVVLLFTEVIPIGILYHKMKNLPDRIFLDELTLTIGNQSHSAGSILNILVVPANYEILTRDVIIVTKDNTKYKFNFGKKDLKKTKDSYWEYDKLCSALELWCIINHVNFMQILG